MNCSGDEHNLELQSSAVAEQLAGYSSKRCRIFLKKAGAVSHTLPLPNPSYRDSGYAELSESARSNKRSDRGYGYMRNGPPRL